MDGRRFRIEPWNGESENSRDTKAPGAVCRPVLSLVTFFAPAKKVTRLQAKALALSLAL
jgi:hypothetical protein